MKDEWVGREGEGMTFTECERMKERGEKERGKKLK